MKYCNTFFKSICEELFSGEVTEELVRVVKSIDDDPEAATLYEKCRKRLMFSKVKDFSKVQPDLEILAKKKGVHLYTMQLVFCLTCSELMQKRHKRMGYPDALFHDAMKDYTYKLKECLEVAHVIGIIPGFWFAIWLDLKLFSLGRFQYETITFPEDYTTKSGIELKKGMPCYSIHIPASGVSLTIDQRMDSYKRAYEFFGGKGEPMIMICSSWLLYDRNKEFLSETSNLMQFAGDFEVYKNEEYPKGACLSYVFGDCRDKDVKDLPENTSMQRNMKQWLMKGNNLGCGTGVFLFDGEKIIK